MSITVQKISRYGWRKDRLDPRDRLYNTEEAVLSGAQLPLAYDLTGEMPPIYDQMQLGSCTANATAVLMQHMQMQQGEPEGGHVPSRLFIYYEERRVEGQDVTQDTGAEIRDGIKVLASEGVPPEEEWPYSDNNPGPFQQRPPDSAFTDALHYEATAYKRIVIGQPGAPMRTAICNHYPIAFGFPVPAAFESSAWNPATDHLPLPDANAQFIGGHAVVVVGYDWTRKRFPVPVFKIRNSWSPNWGEAGHFYMSYEWFDPWRNLADDMWVVMKVS